ncbi:MAG: hypothetical protein ACXVP1_00735 [Thermoleophilia bacterium]
MRGHDSQRGAALILLLGIIAALAIFATILVSLMANQQRNTARSRESKTSLYYAEAGLNSAVNAVTTDTSWQTAAYTNTAAMAAGYNTIAGAPTNIQYRVYDNLYPIDYSKQWDYNSDGMVWVEVTTTYNGRTTTVRELVSSSSKTSILPKAAAYADTDVILNGTSDIYGVNPDDTPDTSGAPYVTTIMVGSDFTANGSTDLASPADGTHTQSLGLQVNGTVTTPGHNFSPTVGGVGYLSDYFDGAHQAALSAEAQTCQHNVATEFNLAPTTICTSASALLSAMTYNSSTKTYTATKDLEYNSSTTLTLNTANTTYNFQKLYVKGNLTLSGSTTTTTTALYVSGNFTISGPSSSNSFGPLYVGGTTSWKGPSSGTLSVTTGPVFTKILSVDGDSSSNSNYDGSSGPTNLNLGPVWVDGDPGTSDVAVNFSGPSGSASTVKCPLLATTEQTHSNGNVTFGSITSPMVYFMQCDNDGLYSNTCQWSTTGTYYGLMVLFEAPINITGSAKIEGAVLEGTPVTTDITMSGSSTIVYNQKVIDNCTSDSLKTTVIAAVPGTWQELKGT